MAQTVIVVGGGAMGLSTAWALTRRGVRPIVLERFHRGHARGASHGATRNFNNAYAEDHYLDLLVRARELWTDLSDPSDPLLRLHGLIDHGDAAGIDAVRRAHDARGIRSRVLDPGDAATRWPGFRFTGPVLHSPDAGVVRAAEALRALEDRVVSAGGEVRWQTPVASVDGEGRVVLADGSELRADSTVMTVGAWSRPLVPASVPLPALSVTEEHPAHFAARVPADWPSFNHRTEASWPADVYGMPTPGEGIKVGFHHAGDEVDPDHRLYASPTLPRLREYVREFLPGLDPTTAVPISCTYTSTETEDFILDRRGAITVGAGFAGHGFKFVPAIGDVLARLATDESFRAAPAFRLPT